MLICLICINIFYLLFSLTTERRRITAGIQVHSIVRGPISMQLMTLLNCCYPRPVNVTFVHALSAQTDDSDSENGVLVRNRIQQSAE